MILIFSEAKPSDLALSFYPEAKPLVNPVLPVLQTIHA
jgi:hypothetical protein